MHSTFPYYYRITRPVGRILGKAAVDPPSGTDHELQESSIDWWMRFLVDVSPDMSALDRVADSSAADRPDMAFPSYYRSWSFADEDTGERRVFQRSTEDEQARMCRLLAAMTAVDRTGAIPSVLATSDPGRLEHLAAPAELTDLIALKDLAVRDWLPVALTAGDQVATGPAFEGAHYLTAADDLITGDVLWRVKGDPGAPRMNGHRFVFSREDLFRLLGSFLLDFSDAYAVRRIGLWPARFGRAVTWDVQAVVNAATGRKVDIAYLRAQVAELLKDIGRPPEPHIEEAGVDSG
ncbi:hypothetical protein [Salininema proteolyticum]|uniref:Uncharacterized protein n=1 Tax=Salininema proteolyticum TaxID=1607685 RepID=A0ABV8TYR4_9ACTN